MNRKKIRSASAPGQNRPPLLSVIVLLGAAFVLLMGLLATRQAQTAVVRAETGVGSNAVFLPVMFHEYTMPQILSFTAAASTIDAGDSVTLNWQVTGSHQSLAITPGVGDVTGQSSVMVTPAETTTYTLTLTSAGRVLSQQVTVTVIPPPEITTFAPLDDTIVRGESTELSWTTTGSVDSLTLTPGIGDVLGMSSVQVAPTETTTYALTAVNHVGSDTAQATITVLDPPPTITSFTVNPGTIDAGESTTLSWNVSGVVESLSIDNGVGDVTGQTSVNVSPNGDTTYTLTAANSAGSNTAQVSVDVIPPPTELLVYDWNQPVEKRHSGFPRNQPPMENGNWVTPVNFSQGTFYYRVEIFSQPEAQDMKLQFCFWQRDDGYNFANEECGPMRQVSGSPGTVVTWSRAVDKMWEKPGGTIDWTRERYRVAVAIKNSDGDPVTDYDGDWEEWAGENPDLWYPLDMRFTVVVVAPDETFSGWGNYE